MTPVETAGILFRLMAAYSRRPEPAEAEALAKEWHEQVGTRHDASSATEAATLWIANEPRFPTISQFLDACADAKRRAYAAERALPIGKVPTYRCGRCLDAGFVEVDDSGRSSVIPCPTCRAAQAKRHGEGHYQADHSCPACDPARKRLRHEANEQREEVARAF